MSTISECFANLNRPRALVLAARFAAGRARSTLGGTPKALIQMELAINSSRLAGDKTYSVKRHIMVLAALLHLEATTANAA